MEAIDNKNEIKKGAKYQFDDEEEWDAISCN
jgi:hypothetical protein